VRLKAGFAFGLLILESACSTLAAPVGKGNRPTMTIDQDIFAAVALNSNAPNACSPTNSDPNWRGIRIQAPQKVKLHVRKGTRLPISMAPIPVCGFSLLDVPATPVNEAMRLVATDARTGAVLQGPIVDLDPSPAIPPPRGRAVSAELLKGVAVGSYFNPNLRDFVALPNEPASYRVQVEFRGFKSNEVTIEIVPVETDVN
jgi:hypothetical protein